MPEKGTLTRPLVRGYRRAYKACLQCRAKKTRCCITAEEYTLGLPCSRCQRELRCCTFPAERQGAKLDSSILPSNAAFELVDPIPEDMVMACPLLTPTIQAEVATNKDMSEWDALFVHDNGTDMPTNHSASASYLKDAHMTRPHRPSQEAALQPCWTVPPTVLHNPIYHIAEGWRGCTFVQQGWLRADEAMHLMNCFLHAMAPRTYVLNRALDNSQYWHDLATQEPFLCCTILMASSRHHTISGHGDHSRTSWLHQRLSSCCLQFITKLMTCQEAAYGARIRTLTSFNVLLLLAEWYPLSLFTDLDTDDWPVSGASNSSGLPQDFNLRARKSEKTSAMIFSCAVALANELGVFCDESDPIQALTISPQDQQWRAQLRKILWVYNGHLYLRIGVRNMLPGSYSRPSHNAERFSLAIPAGRADQQWTRHINARSELVGIAMAIRENLWYVYLQPFRVAPRHPCEGMGEAVDHLKLMLNAWWLKYLDPKSALFLDVCYQDFLTEEHQTASIIANLAGLAAISMSSDSNQRTLFPDATTLHQRRDYVDSIVEGAMTILQLSCSLAQRGVLMHGTEALYLRIALAASSLRVALLHCHDSSTWISSCELLHKVADNLQVETADIIHPANLYAKEIRRLADSMEARAAGPLNSAESSEGPAPSDTRGKEKEHGLVAMSMTLESMIIVVESSATVKW